MFMTKHNEQHHESSPIQNVRLCLCLPCHISCAVGYTDTYVFPSFCYTGRDVSFSDPSNPWALLVGEAHVLGAMYILTVVS